MKMDVCSAYEFKRAEQFQPNFVNVAYDPGTNIMEVGRPTEVNDNNLDVFIADIQPLAVCKIMRK